MIELKGMKDSRVDLFGFWERGLDFKRGLIGLIYLYALYAVYLAF